ncbi:MAG TPA: chemotaxis-specific protein-glutamate methyltransferase CheB [Polyangiales bacterium]|jgi:two-component system chemotaxis response regulator CheB|nr:chemotaxis-specific protein-glutamate methyltransferase CheB [Polyangiales bacterium]
MPQRPLRVLVVDDSAMNRRVLTDLLTQQNGVTVAGVAGDGDEALRLSASLAPDLITLDLEMPRMDGFTFLRLLMATRPTPVVVVSSHSAKENVFRALELGAIDFIAKPETLLTGQLDSVREQLDRMVAIVRQLAPANLQPRRNVPSDPPPRVEPVKPAQTLQRVIVVGASTGGPTALLELFGRLPSDSNACVIVAQHMPERFTRAFADRLDRISSFSVMEADGLVQLAPGHGIVCPGGKCLELEIGADGPRVCVVEPTSADRHAPSADRLFKSAAKVLGDKVLAVVLTGMGDDGAQGVVAVKQAKGRVIVESEETAVIYGMPRSAKQTGYVDETLPLPQLIDRVARLASGERSS